MANALVISTIVVAPCALLSVFLVLGGWTPMGDATSHMVFPGIVLAWIAGTPLAIGAFIVGLFCAVAAGYPDDNSRIKRGTLMEIVFFGVLGTELVLYVSTRSEVHLNHILFGDMLDVSFSDIMQTTVITLGIALITGLKWKDLLLHTFNPHQTKASGLNTALSHYGLLCITALTIVTTLKSVEVILSISSLIVPGAIVILMMRKLSHALWPMVIVSVVTSFIGVYLSFFINSASVPTIAVLFSLLSVMIFTYSTLRDCRLEQQRQ